MVNDLFEGTTPTFSILTSKLKKFVKEIKNIKALIDLFKHISKYFYEQNFDLNVNILNHQVL